MVTAKRTTGLVVEIAARSHYFTAGLPEKLGGNDEGPDPHEILESALAACTILTAQLYADRKGYKLYSTEVAIKILAEGAETRLSVEVRFLGDLSAEEKARLAEIIDKCPIHRLLVSNVKIETTIVS